MTTIYDVPAEMVIKNIAQKMKSDPKLAPPEWAAFAKTGAHKELPPDDADWWVIRCASLLRRISIDGPVGVSRLRSFYGGRHRTGSKPVHFSKGSGSIIREALQQLEKAGFVKTNKTGRMVSPLGQSFLNNASHEVKQDLARTHQALEKY